MTTFFILFFLVFSTAFAGVPTMTTFQARITSPNGAPLVGTNVNFRFTILDTVGTCTIYVEDYANVNMSNSEGIATFSLGSGAKAFPPAAITFMDVFNNGTPSFSCQAGGTYIPGATDRRQIVMQFNDGSGWQTVPQMAINGVIYSNYANRAENLGGYPAADYLRPVNLPTCAGTDALTWNGSIFTCVAASGGGGGGVSNVSGTPPLVVATGSTTPVISMPKATAAVSGYLSSADWTAFNAKASALLPAGKIYLGNASGDATGATLSGDATIATTGVLSLANSGVAAGTYGSANAVPFLTIDAKGRVTNATSAVYQDATNVGKGIVQIGSNLTIASGVLSMTSADITSALGFTPMSGTGSAFVNNGNSFAAAAHLGTNDNNKLYLKSNNVDRMTIDTSGSVGIGTTTPSAKLDVAGTIATAANVIASGNAVDLSLSNLHVLDAVGSSTIALSNLKSGATYTIIVRDTTVRTYAFTGCGVRASPALAPTDASSQTIFGVTTFNISGVWSCYITWSSGFQ